MKTESKPSWSDPGPSWRELQGDPDAVNPISDGPAPNDWLELLRRRRNLRISVILFVCWIPFVILVFLTGVGVSLLLAGWPHVGAVVEQVSVGVCLVYALLAQGSLIVNFYRLRNWRCPDCERLFFDVSPFAAWPRGDTCDSCGAELPDWYRRRR